MRKILKVTLVFVILLLCNISIVNAATNQELISYVSKSFSIAGKSVSLSSEDKVKIERYLNAHPVTAEQADKIIAKIDEAVTYLNTVGVSSFSKLSQSQKEKLLAIAKDAAAIAGATISYDAKSGAISIYFDGVLFDQVSTQKGLKQTGTDHSYIVYAIAGVAVIAVATGVVVRKKKANA